MHQSIIGLDQMNRTTDVKAPLETGTVKVTLDSHSLDAFLPWNTSSKGNVFQFSDAAGPDFTTRFRITSCVNFSACQTVV